MINFLENVSVVGVIGLVVVAVVYAAASAYRLIFHTPTPVRYTEDAVPLNDVCPHGFLREGSAMAAEGLTACSQCIGELADTRFTVMATCPACYCTDYHPFEGPWNGTGYLDGIGLVVKLPIVQRICVRCGFNWLQH